MSPVNPPQRPSNQAAERRRVGRYMITGGLLGWGVIACVAAGAASGQGTGPATFWFIMAFITVLVIFALLVKGYRLETKHNPNFNPQEHARAGNDPAGDPRNPRGNAGNAKDEGKE